MTDNGGSEADWVTVSGEEGEDDGSYVRNEDHFRFLNVR